MKTSRRSVPARVLLVFWTGAHATAGEVESGGPPATAPVVTYELLEGSLLGHMRGCGNELQDVEPTIPLRGTFDMVLHQGNDFTSGRIENLDFTSTSGPPYRISGEGGYALLPEAQGLDLLVSINEFREVSLYSELNFGQSFPLIQLHLFQLTATDDCFSLSIHAVPTLADAGRLFRRGDASGDGCLDISDPVRILGALFLGQPALPCEDAADGNDDGRIDVADPVGLLGSLFLGAPPPAVPSTFCGVDVTEDLLSSCGQESCRGRW